VPFSKTVYVYHEGELSKNQTNELESTYKKSGLVLILRNDAYLQQRQKNWTADDAKRDQASSPLVVYFPGEP
jgi:hypothetical protein